MKSRPSDTDVPGLWQVDGSLRDLYVFGMSMPDWAKFLSLASSRSFAYSFDGASRALPSAQELFFMRDGSHQLSVRVGSATVNCHFFVPSELELDIDPKEIVGRSQHDLLLEFAEAIASTLQKPIVLTPENLPESPFLSFEPSASQWHIRK